MLERPRLPSLLVLLVLAALVATLAAASASAAKTRTVTCRGTEMLCKAQVSLAGGASNLNVVVKLPGTSWRKPTITVTPRSSRGAYSITKARFALGGSIYRFVLNAVLANPKGSHLTLTFRHA